jgi:hypothetical protein
MTWSYAQSISAQMVNLKFFRNWMSEKTKSSSVGVLHFLLITYDTVIGVLSPRPATRPYPAVFGFSYFFEKSFFKGHAGKNYINFSIEAT